MTEPQLNVADPKGDAAPAAPQNPEQPAPTAGDPTPEPQPEGDKPTGDAPAPDPQDEPGDNPSDSPTEPESFEFTVPDTMSMNEDTIAKLGETARELGLTADQLQKLLESVAPSLSEAQESTLKETREQWAQTVATDPDLGGAKLNENMATADKAVETFGDEGLRELLNAEELPLGKNPSMFRFLVKIGAAISDDRAVNPGLNGKPTPQPIKGDVFQNTDLAASVMYGDKKE